jgi:hypothetical protein
MKTATSPDETPSSSNAQSLRTDDVLRPDDDGVSSPGSASFIPLIRTANK